MLRLANVEVDIHSLTTLTCLQELSLFGARVADLSPLTAFKVLRKLNLSVKGWESLDLRPLASLTTLQELNLEHTRTQTSIS